MHVFTPVLMMGLVKGNEYTVIPIGYFVPALHENPTYDGCGESKDKHLGCFFNLTSCRIDEDQVRYGALENRSRSRQSRGDTWAQFASERTSAPGGLSVLRNWMWPPTGFDKGRIAAGSRKPKVQFWNEVRKHGSVGVHGMPHESVEHIWEAQMEFAFSSMISSWMMRQTSSRVKEIADTIMAKYSDASAGGIPLWKAPVLTVHVRQTDKAVSPIIHRHVQRTASERMCIASAVIEFCGVDLPNAEHWLLLLASSGRIHTSKSTRRTETYQVMPRK